MSECYICGREAIANCSVCRKSICKVHTEGEKGKIIDDSLISKLICTSCQKKKHLNRIQIYLLVCCIVMAVGMTIGIIVAGRLLWW